MVSLKFKVKAVVEISCPKCGFRFNITYARAKSCTTCPVLIYNRTCEYIKCPNCGYEFTPQSIPPRL